MTQRHADGDPVHLDFLLYLRDRGFAIGVEQYLHVQALVDAYLMLAPSHAAAGDAPGDEADGEADDETLKTLLCPVFARDLKQQERFYKVFDDYVEHVRARSDTLPPTGDTQPAPATTTTPWWESPAYAGAILLLLAVVALAAAALAPLLDPVTNVAPNTNGVPPVNTNSAANRNSNAVRNDNRNGGLNNNAGTNANVGLNTNAGANVNAGALNAATVTGASSVIKETPPPPLYYWLAVAVPFSILLLAELLLYLKRKLVLGRRPPRKPPTAWPLRVEAAPPRLYDSDEFRKAARMMRRRQVGEYHRLDVPATVKATIAALGFPDFRYRPDSKVPEYLVLIDRASPRDHLARLFDELAGALDREGLFLTRLFYEGDPRVCCDEGGGECAHLSELQNRFAGQRLLVFGDGEGMLDASTGRLAAWAGLFSEWQERALLTPAPHWGLREKALADLFTVAPATPEGVAALAARFDLLVVDSLPLWPRGGSQPPAPDDPRFVEALRAHLGGRVFRWACACAVYPELQWNLTLSLGSLAAVGGGVAFGEDELLRLARLPWFRTGSMPDEARWRLVEEFGREDPAALAEVRAAVIGFLERDAPPVGTFASDRHALELAVQRWLLKEDKESLAQLRETLREVRLGQILQDRTLVRYLERLPNVFLDLLLPRRLRRLFYRHGIPLLGWRTLGRFLVTLLLAAAALLAVWSGIFNGAPQPGRSTTNDNTNTNANTNTNTNTNTDANTNANSGDTNVGNANFGDVNTNANTNASTNTNVNGNTNGNTNDNGSRFNSPPFIISLVSASSVIVRGEQVVITASASDPDGDTLKFDWEADNGSLHLAENSEMVLDTTGLDPAVKEIRIMLRVTDSKGGAASREMMILVMPSLPPPGLTVTGVTLEANPADYSGPCPARIRFAGMMTASGRGTVTYRFVRNDGANPTGGGGGAFSAPQSLTIDRTGMAPIGTFLELGGTELRRYDGWVEVEVLTPNQLKSNPASFKVVCERPQGVTLKSLAVTFLTTNNSKNRGDVVSIRLLANGREVGRVNSAGAGQEWPKNSTHTFNIDLGDVVLPVKECSGLVLVVSKSSTVGARRGRPPFVNASLQDTSAGRPQRQANQWDVRVSAVVRLSDGRESTLLARTPIIKLGEENPNSVSIPIACPSP